MSAILPPRLAALCLLSLLGVAPASLRADAFTPGDVVVTLSPAGAGGAAVGVSLLEYKTTVADQAAPVQTITLPSSASDPVRLTQDSSNSAEGAMSRSADGRYLMLVGYDATAGTASVATSIFPNRVVARVGASGTAEFSAMLGYSGTGVNSAASTDGSAVWVGNQNGVSSFTFGSPSGTQVATNNTRTVNVYGGQLYGSTSTSVFATTTPLPTAGPATMAPNLPGVSFTTGTGYVLLDRSATVAGLDTLYVASQGGGLLKYSFDGTTWTFRGAVGGAGIIGLTGVVNGASADLYATTIINTSGLNFLFKVTDNSVFNGEMTLGNVTFTRLATAPANSAFLGVAFAPAVPEPGALTLGGLAGAGFVAAAIRRRRGGLCVGGITRR